MNSHLLYSCSPWVHIVYFIFNQIMARSNQVRIEFCQYWKFRGAIVLFLVRLVAVIKIINGILSNKRHKINSFWKAILHHFSRFVESFGEKPVFQIRLFDASFIIAVAFHWWAGLSWESVSINLITVSFYEYMRCSPFLNAVKSRKRGLFLLIYRQFSQVLRFLIFLRMMIHDLNRLRRLILLKQRRLVDLFELRMLADIRECVELKF